MAKIPRPRRIELIDKYGRTAIARAGAKNEFKLFTIPNREGFIPFFEKGGVYLIPGEPVCSDEEAEDFFSNFLLFSRKKRRPICFFATSKELIHQAKECDLVVLKIGEEAVLDVQRFSLTGNRFLNVRRGINRCSNAGVVVREYQFQKEHDTLLEEKLEDISERWLKSKVTPQLGFLMGRTRFDNPEGRRVFVAYLENEPQGFVILNPVGQKNAWYTDLLRRRTDATNGIIESLIAHILEVLKEEGTEELYLGMVPFYGIDTSQEENQAWNKLMDSVKGKLDFLYPVESEHFFKDKFDPEWRPVYMFVYPKVSAKVIKAIIQAFIPGGFKALIKHKLTKNL